MEPFIQMTNVSKIYGVGDAQVGALKRLSLSIHRGEFAAIIGPVSYTHLDVYKRQASNRAGSRAGQISVGSR